MQKKCFGVVGVSLLTVATVTNTWSGTDHIEWQLPTISGAIGIVIIPEFRKRSKQSEAHFVRKMVVTLRELLISEWWPD